MYHIIFINICIIICPPSPCSEEQSAAFRYCIPSRWPAAPASVQHDGRQVLKQCGKNRSLRSQRIEDGKDTLVTRI